MTSYEIEIKSLLGSEERAEQLRSSMVKIDPTTKLVTKNRQLNHYFVGGDIQKLLEASTDLFSLQEKHKLEKIVEEGENFSVRTRLLDDEVLLVIKASIDDTTSENGISRIEFESEVKGKTIDELDQLLLDAGYSYQAKWSREREEYTCKGVTVCLDNNAGYGYLAEFEKIVDDSLHASAVKKELRELMKKLQAEELAQDRLERMFAHYNKNWPKYYGTDNIFVIK